jgi:hypothetical protein
MGSESVLGSARHLSALRALQDVGPKTGLDLSNDQSILEMVADAGSVVGVLLLVWLCE